ncbi:MAG: hypothetical protein FWF57_09725 [Defluviitaleaceae bacterium]|nr:hypothetical protein [Defluviitaleaceae bacterium]
MKNDAYSLTKGKFIKIKKYKNFDLYDYVVSGISLFKVSFTIDQFLEHYRSNSSLFSLDDYIEAKLKKLDKKGNEKTSKKII